MTIGITLRFGRVAPLSGGGRGLKQLKKYELVGTDFVAPLSGGGRGLKQRLSKLGLFFRWSLLSPEGGVD